MKVIYFKRNARSPIHIHDGSYADCFYVPDEGIILYKEKHGTFGGNDYSLTNKTEILKEAKSIARGEIPKSKDVSFSDIKEFECDNSKLLRLIQNTRLKIRVQAQVEEGIEDFLKQIK